MQIASTADVAAGTTSWDRLLSADTSVSARTTATAGLRVLTGVA